MTDWFTSDLHFDHTNIIKYTNRPFLNAAGEPDVDLMNSELIRRWNALVQPEDMVYILGDVAMGTPYRAKHFMQQLTGRKVLIWGNHDKRGRKDPEFIKQFEWVSDFAEIRVPDPTATGRDRGTQRIILCHFALRVWNQSHHGSWHLYGHSHGNLADDPHALSLDVGTDCWNFAPASYAEIKERMKQKSWKPVDHHTGDNY